MRRLWCAVPIIAIGCAVPAHRGAVATAEHIAFVNASVVDVENGRTVADRTVLIRGNRIVDVGPASRRRYPAGTALVDAAGKFLIPGLWDMHVHVTWGGMASWSFPLLVAHGVTGVREMGADVDSLLYWRGRTARGEIVGPRIVGTGPLLDGVPPARPEVSLVVRTAAEARHAVDSLAARGVDFIKVYEMLQRDVFLAIMNGARRIGLPVSGHVPLTVDAGEASDLGMRSLEHLRNLDLACSSVADSIREAHAAALRDGGGRPGMQLRTEMHRLRAARVRATYDPAGCTELLQRLARNGTWLVPTLSVASVYLLHPDTSDAGRARLRYVPAALRNEWQNFARQAALRPPNIAMVQADGLAALRRMVALARTHKVGMLAGTDLAPVIAWIFPGFSLHDELSLLVGAGLSPGEALQAATMNPARYLGVADSLGTVAAGSVADLVLLDANPLQDIRNTQRIRGVMLNGQYLDRRALDRLLGDIGSGTQR